MEMLLRVLIVVFNHLWIWRKISISQFGPSCLMPKTRKRRKDGSIITMEDEENERLRIIAATEEKARLWAERDKHLLA